MTSAACDMGSRGVRTKGAGSRMAWKPEKNPGRGRIVRGQMENRNFERSSWRDMRPRRRAVLVYMPVKMLFAVERGHDGKLVLPGPHCVAEPRKAEFRLHFRLGDQVTPVAFS